MIKRSLRSYAAAAALAVAGAMTISAPASAQYYDGGVIVSPYGGPGVIITEPGAGYYGSPYYAAPYGGGYGWRRPGRCHWDIRGC